MVTKLHLPHVIVERLHDRKSNVVILTPETAVTVGVREQQPILVGRIFHPVRATGGSLPCGRYWLAPLTGNKEGCKCLLVSRVKPTLTRFPTNSPYTPMDNTPLHSLSSVCYPWRCCLRTVKDSRSTSITITSVLISCLLFSIIPWKMAVNTGAVELYYKQIRLA